MMIRHTLFYCAMGGQHFQALGGMDEKSDVPASMRTKTETI